MYNPIANPNRFSVGGEYGGMIHKEYLYRNNLKNRNFGKEDPQNVHSERGTIAERQCPSENANCEENPTQPKTDSSSCFGIIAWVLSLSQFCDLKFKYQ